jgi:hypothetical protein
LLYLGPGLLGRLAVEDFDLSAFGHLEIVRRLELAHRVALAQVQVDLDIESHRWPPQLLDRFAA